MFLVGNQDDWFLLDGSFSMSLTSVFMKNIYVTTPSRDAVSSLREFLAKNEGLKHTICFTRIRTVMLVLRPSAENVLGR